MGNWSAAPHANLQSLLESKEKRREFLSVFEKNGLSLAALNCSGNQLHPVDGERQSKVVYDTIRLAELAKDTYFNGGALNLTGRLETTGHENVKDRAWSYITLGIGHGEQWWRQFCYRLRVNGYDGWLSIEHEDIILSRMEGMRRSVDLLKNALAGEPSDYALPAT